MGDIPLRPLNPSLDFLWKHKYTEIQQHLQWVVSGTEKCTGSQLAKISYTTDFITVINAWASARPPTRSGIASVQSA